MAWARVQSKSGDGTGTTTLSVVLTSTPTTGNTIYAYCGFNQAGTVATISGVADGNSNSLTSVQTILGTGSGVATRGSWFAYTVPATPSATFTMTVVNSAANGFSMLVQEVSGSTTTTDSTPGTAFSSTSPKSATYSSSVASEFLATTATDNGNSATGPGGSAPTGSYTADASNDLNGNDNNAVYYKNSTGGSETNSWSWTATGDNVTIITGAFQLPGGGSTGIPDLNMAPMRGNY